MVQEVMVKFVGGNRMGPAYHGYDGRQECNFKLNESHTISQKKADQLLQDFPDAFELEDFTPASSYNRFL